jgi:hypothetical protein
MRILAILLIHFLQRFMQISLYSFFELLVNNFRNFALLKLFIHIFNILLCSIQSHNPMLKLCLLHEKAQPVWLKVLYATLRL